MMLNIVIFSKNNPRVNKLIDVIKIIFWRWLLVKKKGNTYLKNKIKKVEKKTLTSYIIKNLKYKEKITINYQNLKKHSMILHWKTFQP